MLPLDPSSPRTRINTMVSYTRQRRKKMGDTTRHVSFVGSTSTFIVGTATQIRSVITL